MAEPKKPSPSEKRHLDDLNIGKYHFSQGGKSCLNRHVSDYSLGNPCSHRWHARVVGLTLTKQEPGREGQNLFKWPADAPKQPPAGTSWDLDGANFTTSASIPYSFECHHVVPNHELSAAINAVGKESAMKAEIVALVRKGLMEEEYNLNEKINMLILPMSKGEAFALALPKHKKTPSQPSHFRYSSYVRKELDKMLKPLKKDVDKHEEEARKNEKDSKANTKEANRSEEEANRQQKMLQGNEEKGHLGRAAIHKEREAASRSQAQAQRDAATAQQKVAAAQRDEIRKKVGASTSSPPEGMGKQGIEGLSKWLRDAIIEAGLLMKELGLDSSVDDLRRLKELRKLKEQGDLEAFKQKLQKLQELPAKLRPT
ncbi:AHH domain-containing protein [Corallococcus sicarius]|uniref:Uncharacterized protein n=1 Tax=Corallococcus sicarius TaxID=2316726 RepID=A0A3A8N9Z8_9BACT|nr:AHH domain-containing protein [Corallococcus sicarius]RKH40280.1 hypothetical protein D7X12_21230 [Corallococcus sicarius]